MVGDQGIGKSRLLSAWSQRLRADGFVVLSGRCIDVGDLWPYHPIRGALEQAASDETPAAARTAAAQLLRVLDSGVRGDSDNWLLPRLQQGLSGLARGHLLVLILDDMQWMDSSTRGLVLALLSGLCAVRVLILAAVRSEDRDTDPALRRLLRELANSQTTEIMELGPLDRAATVALASGLTAQPLSAQVTSRLWELSGGNPFYIQELLRGDVELRVLPLNLRDMTSSRVEALTPVAQDVVRTLAVATGPVPHELLARILSCPGPQLMAAVRAAQSAHLLTVEEDGYTLRHRLVREAVEAELLPAERILLHRLFAEALCEPGRKSRCETLAHHWLGAGDDQRAFPAVVEAARGAERMHAFSAARRYWEIAAGLTVIPPPPDTPAQCLWRAAEAAHLAGEQQTALNLTERLTLGRTGLLPNEAGPDAQQVRLLRARCLTDLGRLNEALSEYERALALPGLSTASRAYLTALLAETLMRSGQYEAAWERSGLALSLAAAEVDGDTSTQVIAGSALGFSQAYLGDVDDGCSTLRQAVRIADDSGDPEIIGVAHLHLAELLVGPLNQVEEGIQTARSGVAAVADADGSPARRVELLAAAADGLFRLGRWAEAAQLCSQALENALTGTAAADLLLARAKIVMATGDLDRAEQDLRSVQTLLAGSDGDRQLLPLATLRAGLAIWRREAPAARIAVRDGLSSVGRETPDAWLLAPLIWHGLHGEADAAARHEKIDQELVRTLTGTAAALSEQASRAASSVSRWVEGYALLNAAELSRIAAKPDPEAWRLAAQSWDEQRQPYPATYARFRESEALFFQRSRNSAAADLLRATYLKAAAMRAEPLLAEIEALAVRAHVTLDNKATETEEVRMSAGPTEPGPAKSLTHRERQVWQALGAGRTNREIAGHLFISERTVEVHVSSILAKLNAHTRVEAATAYVSWAAAAHRDDP